MGACNFSNLGSGPDVRAAFRSRVEQAQWEHGHGGYSGTIAEKHDVALFVLPARWTADRFEEAVWTLGELVSDQEYAACEVRFHSSAPARKRLAQAERKLAAFRKKLGPHAATLERAAKVANDKWGAAVAVEVSAAERRAYAARNGLKRGQKVFRFFGMASS
jgi:hypothetical protein